VRSTCTNTASLHLCLTTDSLLLIHALATLIILYVRFVAINSLRASVVYHCSVSVFVYAFSALTLLVGRREKHPAYKNWLMRCWCGYLSGARCWLFAYGLADVSASQTPSSLASFKSRLVLPFWYWLTQVVLECFMPVISMHRMVVHGHLLETENFSWVMHSFKLSSCEGQGKKSLYLATFNLISTLLIILYCHSPYVDFHDPLM